MTILIALLGNHQNEHQATSKMAWWFRMVILISLRSFVSMYRLIYSCNHSQRCRVGNKMQTVICSSYLYYKPYFHIFKQIGLNANCVTIYYNSFIMLQWKKNHHISAVVYCHARMLWKCPLNGYLAILYFWFLGQKYYAPKVRPDWGSNSWPPDQDSTFHVSETPALTTRPSVTS